MKDKFQVQLPGEVRESIGGGEKTRDKITYNIRKVYLVEHLGPIGTPKREAFDE